MKAGDAWTGENAFVSEALHEFSQPLTALECGLELSLRQDKTVAELRDRIETLLQAAQLLRRRMLELRALQDAANTGTAMALVDVKELLDSLQAEFLPVAELAQISLLARCRAVRAVGNAERLRNGFFHLLEFLLRQCPTGGSVTLTGRRSSAATVELSFRASGRQGGTKVELGAAPRDMDWRIAQRTFVAAGGRMEILPAEGGGIAAVVTLRAVAEGDE